MKIDDIIKDLVDVSERYKKILEENREKAYSYVKTLNEMYSKYIGQYMAELGHVDAIVWTAGVGERGPIIREKACSGLENYGIKIDPERNQWSFTGNAETYIHADDSKTKIFVVPTDEELVMTEDAYAIMNGTYDVHTNFTYSFQSPDYVNKAREEGLKGDLVKRPNIAKILAKDCK